MTRQEDAVIYFADTFNCSQAVFTAFGKNMGLTENQCLKIGCTFGGGMARRQDKEWGETLRRSLSRLYLENV